MGCCTRRHLSTDSVAAPVWAAATEGTNLQTVNAVIDNTSLTINGAKTFPTIRKR
jgi:hypothetical protein